MRVRRFGFLTGIALILAGGAVLTADAQVPSTSVFNAKIPFSFIVKDKVFPAGRYTLRPTQDATDSPFIFEIEGTKRNEGAMIFETEGTTADRAPRKSYLAFDEIGGKYFLSDIFLAGTRDGNEVMKSAMEKDLEKGQAVKKRHVIKTS
jgi:hypothetical protein